MEKQKSIKKRLIVALVLVALVVGYTTVSSNAYLNALDTDKVTQAVEEVKDIVTQDSSLAVKVEKVQAVAKKASHGDLLKVPESITSNEMLSFVELTKSCFNHLMEPEAKLLESAIPLILADYSNRVLTLYRSSDRQGKLRIESEHLKMVNYMRGVLQVTETDEQAILEAKRAKKAFSKLALSLRDMVFTKNIPSKFKIEVNKKVTSLSIFSLKNEILYKFEKLSSESDKIVFSKKFDKRRSPFTPTAYALHKPTI